MKDFRRILKYVWPQWNRLALVTICAAVIAVLYSLSFATISPLLTVMMGQEGLHGWVNRKISHQRYSVNFHVPDRVDFSDPNVAYHLRIIKVKSGGLAEQAGLKNDDLIVGIANSSITKDTPKVPFAKLLEELALVAADSTIEVHFKRLEDGQLQSHQTRLSTGNRPFYVAYSQRLLS